MIHLPATGPRSVRLAVRAGALPPTRFIILTAGRAGSVLLVTLLDSTPGIRCQSEVLGRSPFANNPWRKLHRHAARAAAKSATAWGTSMHSDELLSERVEDPRRWIGRLHDSGFKIVTLVRDNPVRAGLSSVLASTRGEWHHRADAQPSSVKLDPIVVLQTTVYWEELAAKVKTLVADRSHLAVTYENGLLTPEAQQETVARIRRFLDLPPATGSTPLVRLSTPLREQIENFDEVMDLLASTHLRDHLTGIE